MPRNYTTTPNESKRRSTAMKEKVRTLRTPDADKKAGKTRSNLIEIGKDHENLVSELRNRISELEVELENARTRLQRLDNAENILRMNNLDSLL